MTRELIDNYRKIVMPSMAKQLLTTNYEGMGEQDKQEFERDFNEILDLAIKALESNLKIPDNSDAISRAMVIEVLKDKWNMFSDANDAIQESIDTIEALPPVTAELKTGNGKDCKWWKDSDLGDYPDTVPNQFDNMTGSLNL